MTDEPRHKFDGDTMSERIAATPSGLTDIGLGIAGIIGLSQLIKKGGTRAKNTTPRPRDGGECLSTDSLKKLLE